MIFGLNWVAKNPLSNFGLFQLNLGNAFYSHISIVWERLNWKDESGDPVTKNGESNDPRQDSVPVR